MDLDPTVLATLVGLICNFKQERGANDSSSREEFMAYLEYHRHQDLKDLITRTYQLSNEVDSLLREEHALIISKLTEVTSLLAHLVSKIDGFSGFACILAPDSNLSEQAFEILCMLFDSDSHSMNELPMDMQLVLHRHNGGTYLAKDQRFLRDDLDTLCRLDLLTRDYNSRGTVSYRLTRNAAKFIAAVRKSKSVYPAP